jgi:hypothetical protein
MESFAQDLRYAARGLRSGCAPAARRRTPDREGEPGVAIVNDAFARRWWGSAQDAVGRRVKVGGPYLKGPELEIVGVVGDVSQQSLASHAGPEIYTPFAQSPSGAMAVMLRSGDTPDVATRAMSGSASMLGSTSGSGSGRGRGRQVRFRYRW